MGAKNNVRMMAAIKQFRTAKPFVGQCRDRQVGVAKRSFSEKEIERNGKDGHSTALARDCSGYASQFQVCDRISSGLSPRAVEKRNRTDSLVLGPPTILLAMDSQLRAQRMQFRHQGQQGGPWCVPALWTPYPEPARRHT